MTWPNPVAFDPVTRPNSVVQRCEKNPRQRLDSSISQSLLLLLLLLLLRPFNGLFSRTTWVSQHQKGKPFWILLEQETIRWQSHQLYRMQIICTLLQTDNHASTSPLSFYRPDALPAAQPTASEHWRQDKAVACPRPFLIHQSDTWKKGQCSIYMTLVWHHQPLLFLLHLLQILAMSKLPKHTHACTSLPDLLQVK